MIMSVQTGKLVSIVLVTICMTSDTTWAHERIRIQDVQERAVPKKGRPFVHYVPENLERNILVNTGAFISRLLVQLDLESLPQHERPCELFERFYELFCTSPGIMEGATCEILEMDLISRPSCIQPCKTVEGKCVPCPTSRNTTVGLCAPGHVCSIV